MDLDAQLQVLIDDAPQDGVTPQLVAAIAPLLKTIATQLRHSQYYILQNLEQEWMLTTINNRTNSGLQKNVIYAFPRLQDVSSIATTELDPQLIAIPLPVTNILFQLAAIEQVDSIVFFETPGDTTQGVEVQREDLQHLIQLQLKQDFSTPNDSSNQLPPDIA